MKVDGIASGSAIGPSGDRVVQASRGVVELAQVQAGRRCCLTVLEVQMAQVVADGYQ